LNYDQFKLNEYTHDGIGYGTSLWSPFNSTISKSQL